MDKSKDEYSPVLEAGTGLGKTAVVEGEPFVVVGVPAFNEEKTIAKIVLKAQEYADRVVVCDGGSTDISDENAEQGSKMLFQSWLYTMRMFSRVGV